MALKTPDTTKAKLDHAKLLGFRNLLAVETTKSLSESSDLAFNKIGTEVPQAR